MTAMDQDHTQAWAHLRTWAELVDSLDYYRILGVPPDATQDELRLAFHRFATAFHPDVHPDAAPEFTHALCRVYQAGAEAHQVLSAPELRLRYDHGLTRGRLRLAPSTLPPSGTTPPTPSRPLDECCRSAGAKLSAKRAEKLLREGNLEAARAALEQALAYDGHANSALRERLEAVELALFASGK